MAVKKNETEVTKEVLTNEDPWKQMVTIRLPKLENGESNYLIASVNGKVFKIQRGVEVDVPAPIASVIRRSYEAQDYADAYLEKVSNK